jgi:hypothetical protein
VAPPSGIGTERWRAEARGAPVGLVSGLVLIRDPQGIRTVSARDGNPAWRYLRSGATALAVGASADGRVVAGWWRSSSGSMAVGFDARTGERRWARAVPGADAPVLLVGADDLVVAVPRGRGRLVALRATTGRVAWTWQPANTECAITDAVPAGPARLAVGLDCPDGTRVAGVSTVDAAVRWTWAPGQGGGVELAATPGGVLARAGGSAAVLSADTGTAGAQHPAPDGLMATVDRTALYVGSSVAAVDLAYGRPLWTVPGPGGAAVAATGLGVTAYVAVESGSLRWLDLSAGAVLADREVTQRPTAVWVGPGVVVVASTGGDRTVLVALA